MSRAGGGRGGLVTLDTARLALSKDTLYKHTALIIVLGSLKPEGMQKTLLYCIPLDFRLPGGNHEQVKGCAVCL